MTTDVLTLPRKLRLPLWGIGLGVLAAFATLVSNTFTTEVTTNESEWELQGASNCSDAYGSFDAFIPGMRGNGACNRGGFVPETNVIVVTNRDATGTGSLQAAIDDTDCPKVILFAVSGVIDWTANSAPLRPGGNTVACNNYSIVGASAPGNVVVIGRSSLIHGGYGLGAGLQTRYSNWTVDHMTFTGGGSNDAIDLGSNTGLAGTYSNGILMNSNLIWGGDEIIQHYTQWTRTNHNTLLWQNYIGHGVDGHAGAVIVQNTARNFHSIRNLINDHYTRSPLARADGLFWANNVDVNMGNGPTRFSPCDGGYLPIDTNIRMNVINNLYVAGFQGNWSFPHDAIIVHNGSDGSCTNLSIHESGNRWERADGSLVDCSSNNCVEPGGWFSDLSTTLATGTNSAGNVVPAGYIAETITNTQAGIYAFSELIESHAGQRPNDRIPFIETRIQYALNEIDDTGTTSTYVRTNTGLPTITEDSAIGGAGTGYSVITETPVDSGYDPTDSANNLCGVAMPTGTAADTIQDSGLTGLHEWVIECFYDSVMPAGYREEL